MAKRNLCGHINRQFINIKGEHEPLTCTLEPGHEGNHMASYFHYVGSEISTGETEWSDFAGEYPASHVTPPPETTEEA